MRRRKYISTRRNEQGVIITLVAVFMLFVIGAMAAVAIGRGDALHRSERSATSGGWRGPGRGARARELGNDLGFNFGGDRGGYGYHGGDPSGGTHNEVGGRRLTLAR